MGPVGDLLGDTQNANVVLRLVLDRDSELLRGEVLDALGRVTGRFDDWDALVPLIRRTVASEGPRQ